MHRASRSVALLLCGFAAPLAAQARPFVNEVVYVETPVDTDGDGQMDRLYVSIERPAGMTNLPTIYTISPYAMGGNDVANHDVDMRFLPQEGDAADGSRHATALKERIAEGQREIRDTALARGYASVAAHSVGTGRSTGCPSVGDQSETLAAKAVIDWLGGRARAYTASAGGTEVAATWANGNVGMTGVSYDGTLPNMVATTGVEGLKAIVPVAAISSWYDYYRANGLVVGPGGYIGEDADILAKFIVRRGACNATISQLARDMGRENGDFTTFWQDRDYVAKAEGVRAAVFIMHGQSDWNVRQLHAIRWWEALQGRVPLRMWLHKGGHAYPARGDREAQTYAWFDRYVKGTQNGVENEPVIEVESPAGEWSSQQAWPHEATTRTTLYFNADHALTAEAGDAAVETFSDNGRTTRLDSLAASPTQTRVGRLTFVTPVLDAPRTLSGTPQVQLDVAVRNRRAANLTVAVVEYKANGTQTIVTRGWADPQNHGDLTQGELLVSGTSYRVRFDLTPKQYTFARGSRIGVVVAATDYEHTLRPDAGTELAVTRGNGSYVTLDLTR